MAIRCRLILGLARVGIADLAKDASGQSGGNGKIMDCNRAIEHKKALVVNSGNEAEGLNMEMEEE